MAAGNQYNEHWTLEQSEAFLNEAVKKSEENGFDFIGEVAKELGSYVDVFDYIVDKFPTLKHLKQRIKRNCETNCFSSGKKGDIVPSLAIMNLKSNHGWTDRVDNTTQGKAITSVTRTIVDESTNTNS
jgi:hypothetical protein